MIIEAMVDLETLDNRPTSHILSIGATLMHDTERTFYSVIGTKEQYRSVNQNTIDWWCEQSEAARNEVLIETDKSLKEELIKFADFFKSSGAQYIWSHGDDFDTVILRNAFEQFGIELPWKFWNTRDTRTLIDTAKRLKGKTFEPDRTGVYHNALHDAIFQTKWMNNIWEGLRE